MQAHGGTQGTGIADHCDPAVIRHVEGLVRVGAPRIGPLHPGGQGGELRDGRGPESERAIHMDPRAARLCDGDCLEERIEGAGMQVSCLQADQHRGGA
ncbi:hypothetical protein NicSoilB4_11630 [Arthrobacter sp. NicSoilB4]|nr:hypothetical protein NicSoilB4_11630 [Arthrobacter sp. NicSoilB4]